MILQQFILNREQKTQWSLAAGMNAHFKYITQLF
jgi:hypothetical protein